MADVKNTQAIFSALVESRASRRTGVTRKIESKAALKEAAETQLFTGCFLKESVEEKDVAEDIIDNIVVVTDPDKSVEDLEDRADDIQDAIEGSPEGEAAFSDEYVGDKVYACPICGESFFAEDDYAEGDMCPICKAEPTDGFLLQGIVSAIEPEEEEVEDEVTSEDEVTVADEESVEEEASTEIEDEAELVDDEPANESYKRDEDPEELTEGLFGFGKNKNKDGKDSNKKSLSAAKNSVIHAAQKMITISPRQVDEIKKGIPDGFLQNAINTETIDFDNIEAVYLVGNKLTIDDGSDCKHVCYLKEAIDPNKPLNADTKKIKETIFDLLVKKSPALKDQYKEMMDLIKLTDISKAFDSDAVDFNNLKAAYWNPSKSTITVVDTATKKVDLEVMVKKEVKESAEPNIEVDIEVNLPQVDAEDGIEINCDDEPCVPGITFDEESFDECLNGFAEENYGDCLDSMNVEEVVYSPDKDTLRVECRAVTKEGKKVPVSLEMKEEECDGKKATLTATESTNVFKIESKKPAFEFRVSKTNGVIRCESMKYGYVTTHSTAGKVKVEGFARSRKVGV